MTLAIQAVNATLKGLTHLLARIDDQELTRIPTQGPLILYANHVNFLEVPIVYTRLQPRPITGLVKAETWHNPALSFLFNLWGGIPLKRGEADLAAYHKALDALSAGKIVVVAPEGTRSGDGKLGKGYAGIVTLALRSGAPLMPFIYYGAEGYRQDLMRLRRTEFNIRVGPQFYLDVGEKKVTRLIRQEMVDELMYQLAKLLPPPYRGLYSDLNLATQNYLRFSTN